MAMRSLSSRIFCIAVIDSRVMFLSPPFPRDSVAPVEELAAPAHRSDALHEEVEILVLAHEVQPLGVDDQDRSSRVMIKEPRVAVGEQGQVLGRDRALEFGPAPP